MYLYLFQLYEAMLNGHNIDDLCIDLDSPPPHIYYSPPGSMLGTVSIQGFINEITKYNLGYPVTKLKYLP